MLTHEQFSAWHAQVDHTLADLLNLHSIKQRAYGASWRKHGEYLSIFANITRKADRLFAGAHTTPDETLLDTIADLAVYCMLYRSFLYHTARNWDEGMTSVASAVAAYIGFTTAEPKDIPALTRKRFELLETRILAQINDTAHGTASVEGAEAVKRAYVTGLAALAVLWLAWFAYSQPAVYAQWASQWHTPVAASSAQEPPHATTE